MEREADTLAVGTTRSSDDSVLKAGKSFCSAQRGSAQGSQGRLRPQPCRQRFFKACEGSRCLLPEGRRRQPVCVLPVLSCSLAQTGISKSLPKAKSNPLQGLANEAPWQPGPFVNMLSLQRRTTMFPVKALCGLQIRYCLSRSRAFCS